MDTLKTLLKFHMQRKGLNPTSLSKKANLNATAVRDILEHDSNPSPRIDTFVKLCRALEVSPHQLSPLFRDIYPHQQDAFDHFHQVHEDGEKEGMPLHEVTPELVLALNEWCDHNQTEQQTSKT